jgi:transcription termination/antitermination protein NusG
MSDEQETIPEISQEVPEQGSAESATAVESAPEAVAPDVAAPEAAPAQIAAEVAAEVIPAVPAVPEPPKKRWYVVKIQSGREDSIRNNVERRIKQDNLEQYVARVLVPVEKVTEVRDGKRRVKKLKKYPGYLFVECEFNEHVLYLFRETSGVGDFVGGAASRAMQLQKPPQPMTDVEVQRMLSDQEEFIGEKGKEAASAVEETKGKVKLAFEIGDSVKVRDGMFANMEGPVKDILDRDSPTPKVKVVLQIWGRPVEVDLEYWHVDPV